MKHRDRIALLFGKPLDIWRRRLRTFKNHLSISRAQDISERYFVINAFDGAMVMLGAIIGAYVAGSLDPRILVSVGLGASLAMGISGFSGAYLTEKAMMKKKIKELEEAMFADLEGTVIEDASKVAVMWIAFVDGISPALAAVVSLSPFILALLGLLPVSIAVIASVALIVAILFVLGAYLGRISEGNVLIFGAHTALAGIVTALLGIVLGGL